MMFSLKDAIKNSLLTIYAQRYSRRKKRRVLDNKSNLPESVAFLYTVEANEPQKNEAISRAVERMEASGKQVQVLGYLPNKQVRGPNKSFCFFTKEDINLLGKSKKKELNNFLQTRFEHLYHIDLISEPILDYIIANSNAKYKIGNFVSGRSHLFEISFKGLVEAGTNDKFDRLIDKMLGYTKMLKV